MIAMKKYLLAWCLIFGASFANAQLLTQNQEQVPVFPGCEGQTDKPLQTCFYNKVQDFVYNNFKIPTDLESGYKGQVNVVFEVDDQGNFKVIYIDSNEDKLSQEARRVFAQLPKVGPPTYNGKPSYAKYTIRIAVPLQSAAEIQAEKEKLRVAESKNYVKNANKELKEYDSIVYHKFNNPKFESRLNIPFSHSYYAHFDAAMNQVGANNHTATKPYTYAEVAKYFNLRAENDALMKNKKSWFGRKLWNENTVQIQGEGYWFTLNPIFDLQVGKATSNLKDENTYLNTRGIQIQGGLGEELNFTTTIYESQGRFADYVNTYARSIGAKGDPGNAVIPGIGITKSFKSDSFDMPLAEANLTYTPSKAMNLQLGYGRNFIGDGYRSLITTDGVSPYPFFKINTTFWKIKYTNTYMFLKDIRPAATATDGTYTTKYMANHYLSWNATKRLNIGLFESVVWANTNGRGFDMSFFNPIIFYRSVEFSSSSKSGNALLGLTAKYKWNNQFNFYGQLLVDEFSFDAIKDANKSWKNKIGYQVGAKYFNAFNIENLLLQAEYNRVRPYVYSHSNAVTNYGHANQSIGHQWGGNFSEVLLIARYHRQRYFADAHFTYGKRGLDFNEAGYDTKNYGVDIYKSYNDDRAVDTHANVAQGNTTTVLIADLQAGYLVNPQTNLKFFLSYVYRSFDPTRENATTFQQSTNWFSVGLRCDIFNWYFDY